MIFMARLIQVSDNQYKQLHDIKEDLEKKTGKPVSYKIAIEVYATKKPKSRISINVQKGRPKLPQYNPDFSFREINLDATIKKILK
jgi:hypothetical protein